MLCRRTVTTASNTEEDSTFQVVRLQPVGIEVYLSAYRNSKMLNGLAFVIPNLLPFLFINHLMTSKPDILKFPGLEIENSGTIFPLAEK